MTGITLTLAVRILRTTRLISSFLADGASYGAHPAVSIGRGQGAQVVGASIARHDETSKSVLLNDGVDDRYCTAAHLMRLGFIPIHHCREIVLEVAVA